MSGGGVIAGTITMDGAKMNVAGEVYNNPFEMVGLIMLVFFAHMTFHRCLQLEN